MMRAVTKIHFISTFANSVGQNTRKYTFALTRHIHISHTPTFHTSNTDLLAKTHKMCPMIDIIILFTQLYIIVIIINPTTVCLLITFSSYILSIVLSQAIFTFVLCLVCSNIDVCCQQKCSTLYYL